jgi:hypothetical protein
MKRYGLMNKVYLMLLLSMIGFYCMGDSHVEHTTVRSTFQQVESLMQSFMNYTSHFFHKVYQYVYHQDTVGQVAIQAYQENVVNKPDTTEFVDSDACDPLDKNCLNNEDFFTDNFYGIGDQNVSSLHGNHQEYENTIDVQDVSYRDFQQKYS